MTSRAAAEGRGRLPLAAVGLLAALLLSPTVEASRGVPAAFAPALTSPSTADLVLSAELEDPPARLRIFDDLRLPPRPLELVEARKTASGVSTWNLGLNRLQIGGLSRNRGGLSFQGQWTDPVTGISYARNRWYDARTASWLSEDSEGAIDSPNLYAFVGWRPHMNRDPMGLFGVPADPNALHAWHQSHADQRRAEHRAALLALKADALSYLGRFPRETLADKQYERQLLERYFRENSLGGSVEGRAALLDFVLGPMALNPQGDFTFEVMSPVGRYGRELEAYAFFVVEVSMGMGAVEISGPLARVAEGYLVRTALGRAIRAQLAKRAATLADNPWAYQGGSIRFVSPGRQLSVNARHFSESSEGIRLFDLARKYRSSFPGSPSSRRYRNFVTADVVVDGKPRTVYFKNTPSTRGNPGLHSEERLISWYEEMRARGHNVSVERVFSERMPCGSESANCTSKLAEAFGSDLETYYHIRFSGAAE